MQPLPEDKAGQRPCLCKGCRYPVAPLTCTADSGHHQEVLRAPGASVQCWFGLGRGCEASGSCGSPGGARAGEQSRTRSSRTMLREGLPPGQRHSHLWALPQSFPGPDSEGRRQTGEGCVHPGCPCWLKACPWEVDISRPTPVPGTRAAPGHEIGPGPHGWSHIRALEPTGTRASRRGWWTGASPSHCSCGRQLALQLRACQQAGQQVHEQEDTQAATGNLRVCVPAPPAPALSGYHRITQSRRPDGSARGENVEHRGTCPPWGQHQSWVPTDPGCSHNSITHPIP